MSIASKAELEAFSKGLPDGPRRPAGATASRASCVRYAWDAEITCSMRSAVVVALVWVCTPASRALDWRPWAYIRAPRLAIIGNEMSSDPARTRVKKVSAGLLDGRGGAAILGSSI